ncbi:MAG TPA: ABC transporter substrate-binding protein, partial [Dehalococcoidia bacterium]|nr:ABC transporter substrate-binding protein [Dehalococcoidia bacterium]
MTGADWGTVTVRPGDPIKLGFVAALSGEYAGLGIDEQRGVELAVEDMSQVKGFPVQVQVEDDGCSADGATAAARKIAADPQIVGVVGHLCSNASVPASTVYEQSRIVMISP